MLAYAASRPAPVERKPHPNMLLVIIGAHVAVAALVMSAKMDLPRRIINDPTHTFWIPKPTDPTPPPPTHETTRPTRETTIDHPPVDVWTPPTDTFDPGPPITTDPGPPQIALGGGGGNGRIELPPPHSIVKLGPTLLTSGADLKPPYPQSKLLAEEETTLRLKLTIDERGRVVAVEPVGRADRVFLDAARNYLIGHWRYRPASEDGRPVAATEVITLRFQLDG